MDNIKKFEDFLDKMTELLDKAKKQGHIIVRVEDLENTFPELKESEDERMIKFIKQQLFNIKKTITDNYKLDTELTKAIDWLEKQGQEPRKVSIWKHWKDGICGNGEGKSIYLVKYGHTYSLSSCLCSECDYIELSELDKLMFEKQGKQKVSCTTLVETGNGGINALVTRELSTNGYSEQKSADKVEPKFKVGDWINGYYTNYKVLSVSNKGYVVEDVGGNKVNILFENEKFHHLWTIKDAKDGDVLAADNRPFIYNGSKNEVTVGAYCGFNVKHGFSFAYNYVINRNITPATKEQRDLLFEKMHEAGYEWNSDKLQLTKTLPVKELSDGINIDKQKSSWNEEDEERIKNIISVLDWDGTTGKKENPYQEEIDWLKSLKERCTWKPTKEQMKALNDLNLTGNLSYAGQGQVLIELYNDLKKLMEK